ncbi:hypothetical protein COCNU_contig69478818G000010 [Cocos nucifera]|nr:hypothetical protein [Cocos nucifera]
MKGRSHRLLPSEPPDVWDDGSWTVDCSCGVTFDDGEEMVSCDVCGVWVRTRCSRFTKGEASFVCHNCKKATSAKLPGPPPLDDAEETEVAQLLIELLTKTALGHNHPPFRLWTHVPIEDRFHVQGVPGGSVPIVGERDFQVAESDIPDGKRGDREEEMLGLKQKGSMEIRVMIEKVGQPDPVRAEVAGKTAVASDGEGGSLPKESVKKECINLT